MQKLSAAGAVLALVVTAGCALSPQAVRIDPAVEPAAGDLGAGTTVALETRDARSDPVIGARGGVYAKTSLLTVEGDLAEPVRRAVTGLLNARGFQVAPPGTEAERGLLVEVESLSYGAEGEPVVRNVKLGAIVRAVARGPAGEQNARYQAGLTKQVVTAPDEQDNARMINEVLGKALSRLGADDELLRALAR